MLARRIVPCLATIGFLLLGATGCGGGVPTTGESLRTLPENSTKQKTMAEGYQKKFAQPKGGAKLKQSGP
jgi:hypothetical protein